MDPLIPRLASPDGRLALEACDRALAADELSRACAAQARSLAAAGVSRGDRVAVFTDGAIETAIAILANVVSGYVTVPINPKMGARELAHVLGDAAPRVVVAPDASASRACTPDVPTLPVASDGEGGELDVRVVDDAPLFVLYTSGTTGAPKGAVLTARNVASNLDALARAWELTADDVVVHALPLFHVHGLVLGLLGSLRAGGALSWLPSFDPSAVASRLAERGTVLFAVPTMYHRLADAAERDPSIGRALASARLLVSGSAGLPLREHERIERVAGRGVYERYGLTETLILTAVRAGGPPRPGSVGPALDGVEIRLVDDERRTIDAHDGATIGEVAARGPSVFAGYLNRPEATAAVRDDEGWFYTGDLATRAEDGSLRIVGRRATDLIKTGGFKVGAGEIEACLLEHPGVSEAAVVGVDDADLGERIVAFVVARDAAAPPPVAALVEHVACELAPHKRPRDVRFVASLPRNAMGKVQKATLRDEARRG